MKKIILKLIIFIIILLFLLIIMSYIFTPKNNLMEAGMDKEETRVTKVLSEKENTIDMLIFGDSEAYTSVIPMELWNTYGYTSFICSSSGQVLPDTCEYLYKISKKQKPKIVLLEANEIHTDMSIGILMSRGLYIALPISKYHDRWKNLQPNDFFGKVEYTAYDCTKGLFYTREIKPADSSNYMTYSEEINPVPTKCKIYVQLIKKYCEMMGSKLYIYAAPSAKNWSYARHNGIEQMTQELGIDFIDFNMLANEIGIDWEKDTLDEGDHVNFTGAEKVTKRLGEYLSSLNILENHKDDENYKNWFEDYERYKIETAITKED